MRIISYKSIESIELRRQVFPRAQEHDVNEIDKRFKAKYCRSLCELCSEERKNARSLMSRIK